MTINKTDQENVRIAVAQVDLSSGEAAADAIGSAIFDAASHISGRLFERNGVESAMEFYTALVDGMGGHLVGTLGPINAASLLEHVAAGIRHYCMTDDDRPGATH